MSNSTESLSTNLISETVAKRPRGRPAKYLPEEREQKYKENVRAWFHKNDEYRKTYYKENANDVKKQNKEYQDRARCALALLDDIYNIQSCIDNMPDELRTKVQNLIQHKKIILH